MNQEHFWRIIDEAKAEAGPEQPEKMLRCVEERLSQLSASEIVDWVNLQAFYQGLADRDDLWKSGCQCNLYLSDDSFFYFRGWLLAQGKDVFSSVLREPSTLSEHIKNSQEPYFESFTSVGYDVYAQKAFEEAYGKNGEEQFRKDWMNQHPDKNYDFQWAISGTYDIFSACKERPLSEEVKETLRQEIFDSSQNHVNSSEKEDPNEYVLTDCFGNTYTVYPILNMYVAPSTNLYLGLDFLDPDYNEKAPYCDITVNIRPMSYLEATIDTNNNPQMLEFLTKNGFGEPTGRMIPSGFCQYPVFRFNEEKLKEIDPDGFDVYVKAHEKNKPLLEDQSSHVKATDKEFNNKEVETPLKEVERVLMDTLPPESKEYRKLSIALNSGYKWGFGMLPEDAQRFHQEMNDLFVSAGWEYHEPKSLSYSPEYSKGKSCLYCHPMEITGPCEATLIPEVCQLMAKATTCTVIKTEEKGRIFDMTDDQYFAALHTLRPQIEQDLLKAFSQPEMGSDTNRLQSVMMKYRVLTLKNHANMISSMHPYWKYTEEVFKDLISKGKIVERPEATELSSWNYMTATKHQAKDKSCLDSQIQLASSRAAESQPHSDEKPKEPESER